MHSRTEEDPGTEINSMNVAGVVVLILKNVKNFHEGQGHKCQGSQVSGVVF